MALCKVEYLAQKERIQQRIRAGYPVSYIYQELRDEGAITMSSRSFYRLINADRAGRLAGLAISATVPAKKPAEPSRREKPVDTGEKELFPATFNYDPGASDDGLW